MFAMPDDRSSASAFCARCPDWQISTTGAARRAHLVRMLVQLVERHVVGAGNVGVLEFRRRPHVEQARRLVASKEGRRARSAFISTI